MIILPMKSIYLGFDFLFSKPLRPNPIKIHSSDSIVQCTSSQKKPGKKTGKRDK